MKNYHQPTNKMIIPSPLQELHSPVFAAKGLRLLVKREDLIHPQVSGNKWRKLKYNLEEASKSGKKRLLTFGGAFSNHIYAAAAAGHLFDFETIGLIRGEATAPLNPTLQVAVENGMDLHFVSRNDYQNKNQAIIDLGLDQPDVYVIPEGGTNLLALSGCAEIAEEIKIQCQGYPDYCCLSIGTGGTAAGLIAGLQGNSKVLGFSALKGDFHRPVIQQLLEDFKGAVPDGLTQIPKKWQVNTDYHFGGYARFSQQLLDFINTIYDQYQLPLDPVYTGKMFYGLFQLAAQDFFPAGSTILAIHTGGLQGIAGFNQRFGNPLKIAD